MKHVRHLIITIFDLCSFSIILPFHCPTKSIYQRQNLLFFTKRFRQSKNIPSNKIPNPRSWFRSSLETISLTKRESTIPEHNGAGFHRTTRPSPTTHRNRTQRHRSTCHHCRPSAFHAGKQPTAPSTPVNSTRVTRGGEACLLGKTLPEVSPVRGTKSRRAADLIINV